MATSRLDDEFHQEMEDIYCVAASLDYRPVYFLRLVKEHGGVAAAKRLLSASEAQSGLTKLWELERLDISMEALVVRERWRSLFSDAERQVARKRLKSFGYVPTSGQ